MVQKSLMTLLCLILSFQVFSRPPHERPSIQEDFYNYNQYGKIKSVMLKQLDQEIVRVKDFYESEQSSLGEPPTHTEGLIRATLIIEIESGINDILMMRADLEDVNRPTDQDLAPIKAKLSGLMVSIEELKI